MKLRFVSLTSWIVTLPAIAAAQEDTPESPLAEKEINDLINVFSGFVKYFLDWIPGLGGAVVVVMIIWGGIQYITGDKEKGKKTLIAAIIGAVIVILAYAIINSLSAWLSP